MCVYNVCARETHEDRLLKPSAIRHGIDVSLLEKRLLAVPFISIVIVKKKKMAKEKEKRMDKSKEEATKKKKSRGGVDTRVRGNEAGSDYGQKVDKVTRRRKKKRKRVLRMDDRTGRNPSWWL